MFRLEGKISYLVPFGNEHMTSKEYLSWLRDYEVIKTINRLDYVRPVSFAEMKEYCETLMQSKGDIFLAVYDKGDNVFIGTIRAARINWYTRVADIGILIGDRDRWGKGIATDAIQTFCQYLFGILGLRKLTAGLMSVNPALLKVFEKVGFQREGLFRKQDFFEDEYVDHIYLGCFRDEFRGFSN